MFFLSYLDLHFTSQYNNNKKTTTHKRVSTDTTDTVFLQLYVFLCSEVIIEAAGSFWSARMPHFDDSIFTKQPSY